MKQKILVFVVIFTLINTGMVFANAAEPPSITIIVDGNVSDLKIEFVSGDKRQEAMVRHKAGETYFLMFFDMTFTTVEAIHITDGDVDYRLEMDNLSQYNNVFRLDYEKGILKSGKGILRSLKLISLRLFLTLIVEGGVFVLFGFRDDDSLKIFLAINLLTQGFLNIWINTMHPFEYYGIIFGLIFAEVIILSVEMAAFLKFMDEQGKGITAAYVVVANMASLIFGIFIIPSLAI